MRSVRSRWRMSSYGRSAPRPSGRPMSVSTTSPAIARPGMANSPTFAKPSATVVSARTTAGSAWPVSGSMPVGTSMDSRCGRKTRCARRSATLSSTSSSTPSMGRESPVPSSASTTPWASARRASRRARSGSSSVLQASISAACRACHCGSSSGRGRSRNTETSAPHSLRLRAAARPSPPLLPGPTRTTALRPSAAPMLIHASCATATPAFSMSSASVTPCPVATASRALICSVVTSFMIASPQ